MTTSRPVRATAVLVASLLLWGVGTGPAAADDIRTQQWALQAYKAESDVWPISRGDGVTVAVLDSGVFAAHQDLTGQVSAGGDFSGSHTDGRVDTVGHGTSMAGLIAGHGHGDQAGVMGLAPDAKILPVRIALTADGDFGSTAEQSGFAEALRYAVDHGAKVVNMSFGAGELRSDAAAREAVSYAVSRDVVLVAATGNLGNIAGAPIEYPAAFPGVVAVGAIDRQGNIWARSVCGPEITLVAPGVDIRSTGSNASDDYRYADGTSDATAYVSAIAALVRSKYPALSAGQVIRRMITTAAAPPDGSRVPNDRYGYGIASPSKALAPNPGVDGGARENPLLGRVESQGAPSGQGQGQGQVQVQVPVAGVVVRGEGVSGWLYGVGGVVVVLVGLGGVLLVRRVRHGSSSY
ncbi:type VII secretion-associated serine protease mycosin [Kitasatospora sp. MAP12-15]|uniref:type VII secretion-associated serine protease mycosin n=1 Tax=unclassified Kitasatospora TaxID=2633591 RepID=UPI00247371C5|nr:type VII secretion-associated serine protease mycosin [Kitasatospora sp. MAP12-44]MDH6110721.1 type VII secretion-associated serine protease mycosin [Kitasatospora sp. MAP12-44]